MQAKKDPGFSAKWICRDCIRPGITPCEGQKEKNRRNWQRQKNDFLIGARKLVISRSFFFRKNTKTTSPDAQQSTEQNMCAVVWRSEQPNLRYLPSNSKNSHFCPSRTENCNFHQQSRQFGQNVSRTKFLECAQEAVCQFSATSVGNFSKSSKFTPQLPSINAPPFFL